MIDSTARHFVEKLKEVKQNKRRVGGEGIKIVEYMTRAYNKFLNK